MRAALSSLPNTGKKIYTSCRNTGVENIELGNINSKQTILLEVNVNCDFKYESLRAHDKINELFNNEKEVEWFSPYEIKTLPGVGNNQWHRKCCI